MEEGSNKQDNRFFTTISRLFFVLFFSRVMVAFLIGCMKKKRERFPYEPIFDY